MNAQPEAVGPFSIAAFDVDGTLTNSQGAMDTDALELIATLRNQGVLVVIATARGPSGIETLATLLGDSLWAVTYQGALVGAFENGHWLTHGETTLEIDLAHEIADLAAESGLPTSWHAGPSWYTTALSNEILVEAGIVNDCPQLVDDPRRLSLSPHKLMLISPMDETWRLAEVTRQLPRTVSHTYSHPNYVEISPIGVDKGTGLTDVLKRIGGRPADLIAFGDGENDLAMFQTAAHSVAMSHAPDSIRTAATTVASHGLASALRDIQWEQFEGR